MYTDYFVLVCGKASTVYIFRKGTTPVWQCSVLTTIIRTDVFTFLNYVF